MQTKYFYLLVLGSIFILPGCSAVGAVEEFGCGFIDGKNQDHCYQDAAKRNESFVTCDKIKAETFSALEGPATRDKCYLMVAEQKGDPSGCEKIEGGMISYTKEECVNAAYSKKLKDMQAKIDAAKNDPEKQKKLIQEQQQINADMQRYYEMLNNANKNLYDTQKGIIQNFR